MLSFDHLAKLLQEIIACQKTSTSHVATIFCNHLAKLLQEIIACQKTSTSHVATNFCNHLAKLLQKIASSQKRQSVKTVNHQVEILCSPNEDFGRRNKTEHGIPDFISFMRARNPVLWPKRGIKNRGFRALEQKFGRVFSMHFFKGVSTRFGLRCIETTSNRYNKSFVPISKIFVWKA